jgi:hypothetical protein
MVVLDQLESLLLQLVQLRSLTLSFQSAPDA